MGRVMGVDIMGELSRSPRARLPLPALPTQVHGQVRATREKGPLGLNLQTRPQTAAGLGTGAAQGGRGNPPALDGGWAV